MNRMERLTAILLMLQEKSRTCEEIARQFEVSKRTILRDIAALYEIGLPIISREGAGGGYSLAPGYRLSSPTLTSNETYLLMLALSAVSHLKHTPFAADRASLLAKMRSAIPQTQLAAADSLLAISSLAIPQRTQNTPFLDPLIIAAQRQQWVVITYQSPQTPSNQHILPREIYSQEGFWYCRAYAHERQEERIYRIDRVRSIEPAPGDFNPEIIPQPSYKDPHHPHIIITLTPRGMHLAESEPHLGNHIERQPDGTGRLDFHCPASELDYFARYFAGLGSEAQVLSPPALREQLASIGQNLVEKYQER
jgi:predicted DNA-binding transcriptional regulator YafY